MLRHVILWKFKPDCRAEMQEFLTRLRALEGQIPEILRMEVAENTCGEENYDACLIADFADFAAMERYKTDPRHRAVSDLCKSIRLSRCAVDYEI